jgi:lysophospholipase L1-like esterase
MIKVVRIAFALFFALITFINAHSQNKNIAVIGSSTAWGYFFLNGVEQFPRSNGWVFKTESYYKNLGILNNSVNLAVSGTDCYEGMPSTFIPPPGRPAPLLNANITKAVNLIPKPDVIIVNYPTNRYEVYSNDEILSCLQTIKDYANAASVKCFITTTQPRESFSATERQKLKTLRQLIINQFGDFAIDFWTDIAQEPNLNIIPALALGDGVHLNPTGHQILTQKVIDKDIFGLIPLAVSLSNFSGKSNADGILLSWTTETEINNSYFVVEKSIDGVNFEFVSKIVAKGNTNSPQQYLFNDLAIPKGNVFYRLVMVDKNGAKQYSSIINFNKTSTALSAGAVFPMPATSQLSIPIETQKKEQVTIQLFSIAGKKISNQNVVVDKLLVYKTPINNLPNGTYFFVIKSSSNQEIIRKFIITK